MFLMIISIFFFFYKILILFLINLFSLYNKYIYAMNIFLFLDFE